VLRRPIELAIALRTQRLGSDGSDHRCAIGTGGSKGTTGSACDASAR
jgi:hypothetical protein